MSMTLENRMFFIIKRLTKLTNEDIVNKIEALLAEAMPDEQEPDWFEELSPEQQTEITNRLQALEAGKLKTVSNEHVQDRVKQFFDSKKEK